MSVLLQLYSARNFLPWERVLDQAKANGFDGVEGLALVYDDPARLRRELDARGLTMPLGMFPLATIEGNLAEVIGVARTLGMGTIVAPFLPPPDRPTARGGWQALGARLNALARSLRAEDLAFAWHNHDFEVVPAPDGAVPLDVLLDAAPDLLWEADLGWIFRAGGDPLAWIRSRGNRITAVHLKDVQPHFLTAPEGGWADLGHGVNDWSEIFTALERLPLLQAYVAEHDDPSDLERFLKRWMASFLTGREQARTLNSSSSGVSR